MPAHVAKANTVQLQNSLVQSKIKPTAEIHILVGGPYVKDGKENRYGHTAIRVISKSKDLTYDFGRYGATRGPFGESGDGILRVWSKFRSYISGENSLTRKTTGFVYFVYDHQADAAVSFFNEMIKTATHLQNKDRPGMTTYKLAMDYYALGPNCTTLSMDAAKSAIPNIDRRSEKYNNPRDVLAPHEWFVLTVTGGSNRLFLPENLRTFLATEKAVKVNRVDTYGGKK